MPIITILEIASPLLAAFGGAVLTYDAARDPLKWWARRKFAIDLKLETTTHKMNLLPLKSPPYSSDERDRLINAENVRHEAAIAEIEDTADFADLEMSYWVRKRAFWGFLLVTIGCCLQAAIPLFDT